MATGDAPTKSVLQNVVSDFADESRMPHNFNVELLLP